MPMARMLRLGLRQFAAGMLSVLALGILNRVMNAELGIDLGLVSLVIGLRDSACVGGLSLMMGISTTRHVGLFMGVWILSQAVGNGIASVGGVWLHDVALMISGAGSFAHAAVSAIESVGLVTTSGLLPRLSPAGLRDARLTLADA